MATKERLIIESMFRIPDKEGKDVDFILNPTQAKLDSHLSGRDIIPKARQEGISTYYLARWLAKCLYKRNTRAVVISHDRESTQRMLSRVHYMIENIRGPKPVIKNSSKNEITFPKTNSMFYLGTAGSRKFGRGDTITDLHVSEVAYWDNPKDLLAGLFSAVPIQTGEIGIESTGNGVGNWYHRQVMRALDGKSTFRLHFFDWISFPEYDLPLSDAEREHILNNLDPDLDELELVEQYGLTAGQIKFRRQRLEETDYDLNLFKQEYPIVLSDCFQSSGRSIFHKVNYKNTDEWKRVDSDLYILDGHPREGYAYCLGADVGGGVGQDNSVIEVFCIDTMEQVAEWVSNRIDPETFAHKIKYLCDFYNKGYVTVESNNHGIATLAELKDIYPSRLIHKTTGGGDRLMQLGVRTTSRSKPMILGNLRKLLLEDVAIHSDALNAELSTFIEKESGRLEAEDGCHDDRVIAAAMALANINRAAMLLQPQPVYIERVPDPFSMDAIIKEMRSRGAVFPIAPQHLQ